jgi:hypothetical protein
VCIEMQCRHILAVFMKQATLPSLGVMQDSKDLRSRDSILTINYYDTLMRDLNALPPIWSSWFYDPVLAYVLWFRYN